MPGSVAGVGAVVVDVVVLVVMVDEASVVLGSFSTSRSVLEILEKCKKDIKNQHSFLFSILFEVKFAFGKT